MCNTSNLDIGLPPSRSTLPMLLNSGRPLLVAADSGPRNPGAQILLEIGMAGRQCTSWRLPAFQGNRSHQSFETLGAVADLHGDRGEDPSETQTTGAIGARSLRRGL
jgi:hypothetical protein